MKRIIFLVFVAIPFFVAGCASNPPTAAKEGQKEASAPVSVLDAKKEIIFPSRTGAITAPIANGDIKQARMQAAAKLVDAMKQECQWKNPLNYYGGRVILESMSDKGVVYVRARMDSSLCPEKK
jgi:hypothetical protein